MVAAHAVHETQLILRLVSQSLRSRIDCYQARHLVISTENSGELTVTSSHRHIPFFAEQAHIHDEPGFWTDPRTRARVSHTRVLDIQGYCPPVNDPDLFSFMRFPGLEILRMTPSVNDPPEHVTPYVLSHFPAKTLVLFSTSEGQWAMDDHWWFMLYGPSDDEEIQPLVPEDANRARIPGSVTKIVMNLRGYNVEFPNMFPFTTKLPEHVKEVVVTAPFYHDLKDKGGVRNGTSPHLAQLQLKQLILYPKKKITLVGFDRYRTDFERKLADDLRYMYKQTFFSSVDYTVDDELTLALSPEVRKEYIDGHKTGTIRGRKVPRDPRSPLISLKEQVDRTMANVTFLSKQEYIDRVGSETAALELLEHPHPEDRACVEKELDWRKKTSYSSWDDKDAFWNELWESSAGEEEEGAA